MINLEKTPLPSSVPIPPTPVPVQDQPCLVIAVRWCPGSEVWHLGRSGAECSRVVRVRVDHTRPDWNPVVRYSLDGQSGEFTESQLHDDLDSLLAWVKSGVNP